jgi:hypothetical protein
MKTSLLVLVITFLTHSSLILILYLFMQVFILSNSMNITVCFRNASILQSTTL